ncbi:MAG TPA: XRE family transcriptional regulator [Alphaproteobacteria bacterium]|jgi:transcriptional regulator with XRE-family HTH domain|nr:XRE family transcriptional regulator [Alphaproteobacteria bacterium]MDP6272013.1 XRE family transcriptional regulator [Alphaproteobacteria bacterium]HJM49523.1 XRE family transcriptional regulator [Alphaproteobacteria bacterium]
MAKSLEQVLESLPPDEREAIAARTGVLLTKESTLRDLRKALDQTQVSVAQKLRIGQDSVSRLESRSDLLLSTLRGYIEAMGGSLELTARFPDRPPVRLAGLGDLEERKKQRR